MSQKVRKMMENLWKSDPKISIIQRMRFEGLQGVRYSQRHNLLRKGKTSSAADPRTAFISIFERENHRVLCLIY